MDMLSDWLLTSAYLDSSSRTPLARCDITVSDMFVNVQLDDDHT